jgi:hypothetical protein
MTACASADLISVGEQVRQIFFPNRETVYRHGWDNLLDLIP